MLSNEQQEVVDELLKEENSIIKVEAVSGAGKTHLLTESVKILKPENGMYLAYNKKIAEEAKMKFPALIKCSTVHSMAYRTVVFGYGFKVGNIKVKDMIGGSSYSEKAEIDSLLKGFCLSKYDSSEEFFASLELENKPFTEVGKQGMKNTFQAMKDKKLDCSHDFYLKVFQLLLSKKVISPDPVGIIMLDEAGDVNPVTLEIFKNLPSVKKMMVGDREQNIYSFNGTINGFIELKEGKAMKLSKSFRVGSDLARYIEPFMQTYLNKDAVFTGVEYDSLEDDSVAYISRVNSTLVKKIIELLKNKTLFNLTKDPKNIFELPVILSSVKRGYTIFSAEYSYLQDDIREYFNNEASYIREYSNVRKYILAKYSEEPEYQSAMSLLATHSAKDIYWAKDQLKNIKIGSSKHKITLTTAHSSKGLEYGTVFIMDDMNSTLSKIKEDFPKEIPEALLEEFRIYYVACTRAKTGLYNANHLMGGYAIEQTLRKIEKTEKELIEEELKDKF